MDSDIARQVLRNMRAEEAEQAAYERRLENSANQRTDTVATDEQITQD